MTQEQRNGTPSDGDPPIVNGVRLAFGTPRKLPKASKLPGRVAVVDIAFASESGGRRNAFEKTTMKLIDQLGPRLVAWVDHHEASTMQSSLTTPVSPSRPRPSTVPAPRW